MSVLDTSDRFLRPDDLRLIRRNRRQLRAEKLLAVSGRFFFAFLALVAGWWIYQRIQQDERFAVRSVELGGVKHTSRAELTQISQSWIGLNLFKLDIERVQRDLRAMPWIARVSIEKKLPSTLKIVVAERQPVALASIDGSMHYVDGRGQPFAVLSPAVGNPDLPLVSNAQGRLLAECVHLLETLKRQHPALYSRISEISPAGGSDFVVFDRDLKTRIFLDGTAAARKWVMLYGIARVEGFRDQPAEYIDLRFDDRIVVKPISDHGSQISERTSAFPPRSEIRDPTSEIRQPKSGEKS